MVSERPTLPEWVEVAIVGAGIAGAAVARELARRGRGPVLIVEREEFPGMHATGRNAALVLQNVTDATNCRLAQESRKLYESPPADWPDPPEYRPVGSLLLASGPGGLERSRRDMARVRALGLEVHELSPGEASRRVPILDGSRFHAAVWCPTDGVMDIHALLQSLLKAAQAGGARLATGVDVTRFLIEGDRLTGLETNAGVVRAGTVIIAAGPWAAGMGVELGAPLPLRPTRRHIVVTEPTPLADPRWPFVWDSDTPFYFRPESGGLLMSPCDIEDAPECDEATRPDRVALVADKAAALIPAVASLGVARSWAGLRTLTPDDRFVIGHDPRRPGLFWLAGLGGHGISAGPLAGQVAADLLVNGKTDHVEAALVSPERFLR